MQTSASIQRTAQLRPFSISTASVKAWLNGKSKFFTKICSETVTRRQVLRVHIILVFMGLALITAEASFIVSLLSLTAAAHHVYKLNQEDGQQTNGQKGGAL